MTQTDRVDNANKKKDVWFDKAIDIQLEVLPGVKGLSLSKVRQKSPEKAIEMAEYIYRDTIEKSDVEPSFKKLLKKFDSFKEEDRPKVVGIFFECCETFGPGIPFTIGQLKKIMKAWNLDERKFQSIVYAFLNYGIDSSSVDESGIGYAG